METWREYTGNPMEPECSEITDLFMIAEVLIPGWGCDVEGVLE